VLEDWLKTDSQRPRRERRTARRLFEGLQREGYAGAYDSVQRFVRHWKAEKRPSLTQAFVPLSFLPGAKYQFDWSHEVVFWAVSCRRSRWPTSGCVTAVACSWRPFRARRRRWSSKPTTGPSRVSAGCLWRYLRQPQADCHDGLRRQGAGVQPPLPGPDETITWSSPSPAPPPRAGRKARWKTKWATSGSGCSRRACRLPVSPSSTPGWNSVAGAGRAFPPEQGDRRIAEVFEEERPLLRPFTAAFDGYSSRRCGLLPPAWWPRGLKSNGTETYAKGRQYFLTAGLAA